MESLRDKRRAGASVGCVARVFETLGDTESNHTTGTVPTEDSRNYWQWLILLQSIQERKSNDGAWVSESVLPV